MSPCNARASWLRVDSSESRTAPLSARAFASRWMNTLISSKSGNGSWINTRSAGQLIWNEGNRGGQDDELACIDRALIDVAQPAHDFARFLQWAVEVLKVKEGRTLVLDDVVQRGARPGGCFYDD